MTAPVIVVSSRDREPAPHVLNAAKLAELAAAKGWAVEQTYAVADIAEVRIHSVVVRLAGRGFAVWLRRDEQPWHFAAGFMGVRRLGFKALCAAIEGTTP